MEFIWLRNKGRAVVSSVMSYFGLRKMWVISCLLEDVLARQERLSFIQLRS